MNVKTIAEELMKFQLQEERQKQKDKNKKWKN